MRSMVPHWTSGMQPVCDGRPWNRDAYALDSAGQSALIWVLSSAALDISLPKGHPMQLKEWPPEMTRADLMTVSEAAAELGYRDGRQIRAAIRDGRLDGYRPLLGRAALVARADVDRLKAPVAA
nr:MAG TPA: regulatory protein [Siphoviridae sp. ctvS314]